MISEFKIDSRIKRNRYLYYRIRVHFSYFTFSGRVSHSLSTVRADLDDELKLILIYLNSGVDKDLVDPEVGNYIKNYLEEEDLIFVDKDCKIDKVDVVYVDKIHCHHDVIIPEVEDMKEVIEEMKKFKI